MSSALVRRRFSEYVLPAIYGSKGKNLKGKKQEMIQRVKKKNRKKCPGIGKKKKQA